MRFILLDNLIIKKKCCHSTQTKYGMHVRSQRDENAHTHPLNMYLVVEKGKAMSRHLNGYLENCFR